MAQGWVRALPSSECVAFCSSCLNLFSIRLVVSLCRSSGSAAGAGAAG